MKLIVKYIFLFLFLSSCGEGLKKGAVINKWVIPAGTNTTYIMIDGVMYPMNNDYPEQYMICIGDSLDHKYYSFEFSTDEQEWNSVNIGDTLHLK